MRSNYTYGILCLEQLHLYAIEAEFEDSPSSVTVCLRPIKSD